MPFRCHARLKRSSLPTIQEEPTPTPVISRSSPAIMTYNTLSHAPLPTPITMTRRNSSSDATPVTSTWGTISPRSLIDDDECAILDDSDEEFGPPNSLEPLTFPRTPPRKQLSQSLSLLALMLANVKELAKRPRHPSTPVEGAFNDSDCESNEYLEMPSRGRRVRRRRNRTPNSSPQDNTTNSPPPEETNCGNVEVGEDNAGADEASAERNTEVSQAMEIDEFDTEIRESIVRANRPNVNLSGGNGAVRDDKTFWDDFMENHGGYNAHGW